MATELNKVSNQEAAIARAKELIRTIIEAKTQKADYEKIMKEAISELEQLATENRQGWFMDRSTDEMRKSCDFGIAKIVWKTASPKYEFKKIDLYKVIEFAKKFPNSIKFDLKAMSNINLDEFGIEKTDGKETLTIE